MTCFRIWALVALALAVGSPAQAFIAVRSTQSGTELHWPMGSQLTYRANTTNGSGMAAGDLFSIFTTSLGRWKQAALDGFSFVYYQGTDKSRYPNYTGSLYDNSIFFTSNGSTSDRLPCGIIALTQVWFDPATAVASKADLRFNDNCYTFTTNPADTATQSRIFLGDVATHELGHSLGLDHSQNLQSSMIYTAAIEMSLPACDDQAAMRHLYQGDAGAGKLTGRVLGPSGAPVFGAHVSAIQLDRGIAVSSTLSDVDGSYSLNALEPGTYGVLIEPYYPGSSTLGAYYSAINANVCGGQVFSRTFVTDGTKLRALAVAPGTVATTGNVAVSCTAPASLSGGVESSFANAPVLSTGDLAAPVGTQSVFASGTGDHYYRLVGYTGRLSAHALAYSLFSRADVQVELLDSAGLRLSQSSFGNVFSAASSGYINYDASADATLNATQDVYVHVFSRLTLATARYPSGSTGVSATNYYVLTLSRGAAAGGFYAPNARCESSDGFAVYSSPGEAPGFSSGSSDGASSSGCGTLVEHARSVRNNSYDASNSDGGPFGGAGAVVRLGNFFLIALLLVAARHRLRAPLSF